MQTTPVDTQNDVRPNRADHAWLVIPPAGQTKASRHPFCLADTGQQVPSAWRPFSPSGPLLLGAPSPLLLGAAQYYRSTRSTNACTRQVLNPAFAGEVPGWPSLSVPLPFPVPPSGSRGHPDGQIGISG